MASFRAAMLYALVLTALFDPFTASSDRLFAGDFRAPPAPSTIVADYRASFVQHKWDVTGISHIASGMIYADHSGQRLRMDLTYEGAIASSFFNYAKANTDGTIPNYVYTLSPSTASAGACTHYNVTPAYPLFPPTILADYQATFAGHVIDDVFYANREPLQVWDILYGGAVSVKFFLDNSRTVVRMDFSSPGLSTFTTTRLFNIVPGAPAANLFGSPCPTDPPTPTSSGGRRSV